MKNDDPSERIGSRKKYLFLNIFYVFINKNTGIVEKNHFFSSLSVDDLWIFFWFREGSYHFFGFFMVRLTDFTVEISSSLSSRMPHERP